MDTRLEEVGWVVGEPEEATSAKPQDSARHKIALPSNRLVNTILADALRDAEVYVTRWDAQQGAE